MKNKVSSDFSRRSFLKWTAATAALSAGLTACGSDSGETIIMNGNAGATDTPLPLLSGGKWITVPCPGCASSRCVNRAYMVDRIPVRQKTDDTMPQTEEYPQYRACIKGRAMKWTVFNPDRLKYPMKRKGWQPGGGTNSNGSMRGKDEWIRISWDEALSLITQEFKRILTEAGVTPTSTPTGSYGFDFIDGMPKQQHPEYAKNMPILNISYTANPIFLNAAGYGTVPVWGHNSSGAFPAVVNKIAASPIGTANTTASDRLTVQNHSDLILLWGQNPTWTKYGPTQIAYAAAKKRGAKIICVDSWLNPGNSSFVDEWIPCRPGTDTALLLAAAYCMIAHDEDPAKASEPRWVDQDFLDKYTVGFDAAHVPTLAADGITPILVPEYGSDGKPVMVDSGKQDDNNNPIMTYKLITPDAGDNFHDYIMGVGHYAAGSSVRPAAECGPKNPAWASKICGTPVDKIELLAKSLGTIKPAALLTSNAPARTYNGGTFVHAFFAVGFMTGNIGKKGARIDWAGNASFAGGSYGTTGDGSYHFGTGSRVGKLATLPSGTGNPRAEGTYGAIGMPWQVSGSYDSNRYYGVAFAETWDAVLTGQHHNFVHGMKKSKP